MNYKQLFKNYEKQLYKLTDLLGIKVKESKKNHHEVSE